MEIELSTIRFHPQRGFVQFCLSKVYVSLMELGV